MAAAGYSGTPLIKKLGIKPESKLMLVNAPGNYMSLLGTDIDNQLVGISGKPDIIHLFVKSQEEFESEIKRLYDVMKPTTAIWVSWYKKTAKIPTDVTEDTIRNFALGHDLVDIKVCAVNEIWSGLKLVIPMAKR